MTIHCSGLCGRVVTEAGAFCSGCDVPVERTNTANWCLICKGSVPCQCLQNQGYDMRTVPVQTLTERESFHLRQRVLHHAYRLAMGSKAEQKDALEELNFLLTVLNRTETTT